MYCYFKEEKKKKPLGHLSKRQGSCEKKEWLKTDNNTSYPSPRSSQENVSHEFYIQSNLQNKLGLMVTNKQL